MTSEYINLWNDGIGTEVYLILLSVYGMILKMFSYKVYLFPLFHFASNGEDVAQQLQQLRI